MDLKEKNKSEKELKEEKDSRLEKETKKEKAEKPEIINVGISPDSSKEEKIKPGTEADAATG